MVYPKQSSFLCCLWLLSPSSKMDIKSFVNGEIHRWDAPLVVSVPLIYCLGMGTSRVVPREFCVSWITREAAFLHWTSNITRGQSGKVKWLGPFTSSGSSTQVCLYQVVGLHQSYECHELFSLTCLFFSWSSSCTALLIQFAWWLEVTQQLRC